MFKRLITRLLLLVMLSTVFSPSFGWEIVDGVAPHEHGVASAGGEEHSGSDGHGMHAAVAGHDDQAGCDQAACDQAACDEQDHHCCPGHILGHLPGGLGASGMAVMAMADSFALDGHADRFASRVPEGLERPPRAAA